MIVSKVMGAPAGSAHRPRPYVGGRDGSIIREVHAGQTIDTPPGEEHFHAAAHGSFMEHLAMLEAGDDTCAYEQPGPAASSGAAARIFDGLRARDVPQYQDAPVGCSAQHQP